MRSMLRSLSLDVDVLTKKEAQELAADAMGKGVEVHAYPEDDRIRVRLNLDEMFAGQALVALLQLLVKHGDQGTRQNVGKLVAWMSEDQPTEG